MGTTYRFKCVDCDYQEEFWVGCGMLDGNHFKTTEQLQEKLKKQVLNGEYGERLKRLITGETGRFRFDCEEDIYQCYDCLNLSVIRNREAISNDNEYDIQIRFEIKCPHCSSTRMKKTKEKSILLCPKCKKHKLELIGLGKFD